MTKQLSLKAKNNKQHFSTIQKIIISIIIIAMLATSIAVISVLIFTPEKRIKSQIELLATDYYKNYLYQNIADKNQTPYNIEKVLSNYAQEGFSSITLRDLLWHDVKKSANLASTAKKYCDINETTIKFYPEPPFTQDAYRIEYNYSCNF